MATPSFTLPKFYRNFAWLFFVVAVLLLVFVIYLIWAKVTVIIYPATQKVEQEFIFDVREGDTISSILESNVVSGLLQQVEVDDAKTFTATGSKQTEAGTLGEVTIINNYSKDQTLVATTRLANPADPDTVLVRLSKNVVVPAGGQIKVQVYADNPENFSPIKPMRFVIPGLWGPLQEYIYAENEKTLGEVSEVSFVTQQDLDQASEQLKQNLYQRIISEANKHLMPPESHWPRLVVNQQADVSFDVATGDEVSEFRATMKLKALLVIFNEEQVITLARNKIKSDLGGDKRLINLNPKDFSYAVDSYKVEDNTASVRVKIAGGAALAQDSNLLNKDNLVGKTEAEIKSYFSQFSEVDRVEVKFWPAWLKKTPRIKEKIELEIQ